MRHVRRRGDLTTEPLPLEEYALAGAVGIVALLIFAIFVRSRILERQRARNPPIRTLHLADTDFKPRPSLYDVYIGSSEEITYNAVWDDIMVRESRPSSCLNCSCQV